MAEIGIEPVPGEVLCPKCASVAKVKERPWVTYVDLRFGALSGQDQLEKASHVPAVWSPPVLRRAGHLPITATRSLFTTRAAKWATKEVGGGRTITEVAGGLGCDWGW